MIGALVTMLQGGHPLPFLTIGFPISLVVAWWWTAGRLRADIAEVILDESLAGYRSLWDVATRRSTRIGAGVLDVRRRGADLLLTIGLDTITLHQADWPDLERIEAAFRAARDEHVGRVRRTLGDRTSP